jgi:hypothetical protein
VFRLYRSGAPLRHASDNAVLVPLRHDPHDVFRLSRMRLYGRVCRCSDMRDPVQCQSNLRVPGVLTQHGSLSCSAPGDLLR